MSEPEPLRLIFFGTPEFAVPALRGLAAGRHPVVGVVSQPDRPRGRGRAVQPTPVHAAALELGLPLLQPQKVGDEQALAWMRGHAADLGVVVAFGQFLPRPVRELPAQGLINAHASLLPRWRGAAPIEWAIREGDSVTGISIMRVVREMDAGDVCLRHETPIGPEETAGALAERLAGIAAEALGEAIEGLAAGRAVFEPQDGASVTAAPKIDREFARLDLHQPAARVLRRVLASTPRPGADLDLRLAQKRVRLLAARLWPDPAPPARPCGVLVEDGRLAIGTLDGWVEVLTLQVPGRRPVSAAEFLRATRVAADEEVTPA